MALSIKNAGIIPLGKSIHLCQTPQQRYRELIPSNLSSTMIKKIPPRFSTTMVRSLSLTRKMEASSLS